MTAKLPKILFIAFTIFAVLSLADFFYAHKPISLISAVGFGLVAYGNYKNLDSSKPRDRIAYYGTILGLVICIGTFVAKYLP